MSNREEYIHKMQTKLEEWNSEIDTLTTKAGDVTADVKQKYREKIESLKEKQAEARQKIEELQQTGESAWGDLKSGMGVAWTGMGKAIDTAKSRFK
jgi:peptidoglycan hydrolase CwlO-like protein